MEAGKLRHFVAIEELSGVRDEYGEPGIEWTPFCRVWAAIEDLNGREGFAAQQVFADVTTQFTMRYRAGITATMRITTAEFLYNIRAVTDADGRRRMLTILASREVPSA